MADKTIKAIPDMAIDIGESNISLSRVQVWVQSENWLCKLLRKWLKFTLRIQWVELPQGDGNEDSQNER